MNYTMNRTQYDYNPAQYGKATFAAASVSITRYANASTYERVCLILCTKHGDIQTIWLHPTHDEDIVREVENAARTMLEEYDRKKGTTYVAYLKEHAVRDVQYDIGYMSDLTDCESWTDYPDARIFVGLFSSDSEGHARELAAQFARTDMRNVEVLPVSSRA